MSNIYKFFISESPEYFNEIYFPAEPSKIIVWPSFQRLKQLLRKLSKSFNSAPYIGPSGNKSSGSIIGPAPQFVFIGFARLVKVNKHELKLNNIRSSRL